MFPLFGLSFACGLALTLTHRFLLGLRCPAKRPRLGASLGANLSGIRYFGDFERFDAISRVAAEKLREIEERFGLLLPA